jgi:tRNA uridine 5-carboxymethylaminomethyl modification enzyme
VRWDAEGLERQDGDVVREAFSFMNSGGDKDGGLPNAGRQVPCFKTFTSKETHQIVRDNLHLSVHIRETKNGPYDIPLLRYSHELTCQF